MKDRAGTAPTAETPGVSRCQPADVDAGSKPDLFHISELSSE